LTVVHKQSKKEKRVFFYFSLFLSLYIVNMNSELNVFVDTNLLENDGRHKKRHRDELETPTEHIRQRRRLNHLYDLEVQRRMLLEIIFNIACIQGWPRTTLFTATYLFDSFAVEHGIALKDPNFCGLATLALASKFEERLGRKTRTAIRNWVESYRHFSRQ
jgi:hypothetical protein